jgi:AraC-like DNA-binding protein
MQYAQIPPPTYLKEYIRYFWTLESNGTDLAPKTLGPLADGCPGLIFQPSEKGLFYEKAHKPLAEIHLYGQTISRTAIYLIGNFQTIGICFFPNTLKSIFGFNADELTDSCLDVSVLAQEQGICLKEQLLNASSQAEQIEILSSYLFTQIRKTAERVDELTHYLLSQIIRSNGKISLRELQVEVQLSERGFERRFKQYVGISPKLFSRICQFQASLQQLRSNQYIKLSDVAFDNGYADQSHFIRVFKEFAGFSPYQFQKQSYQVADHFPALLHQWKTN